MQVQRHRSGRGVRRLAIIALSFLVVAAGFTINASPAEAVRPVPWRFTTVTMQTSISGWNGAEPTKGWVLQCPAGYTAVSGGVIAADIPGQLSRLLEYPNPADGTYHLILHNEADSGTALTLTALCVWADDVGPITTVTAEFARNGSGFAGGIVRCPEGTKVFSGGVDWSTFNDGRRIYYSTPITDGTSLGTGWYVQGHNSVSSVLGIELRCVATAQLAGAYVEADDAVGPGAATLTPTCVAGHRVLTGGAAATALNPAGAHGYMRLSGPLAARQWRVSGSPPSGVTMRALAICVPASTVSVSYVQTPAALSNTRNGSIAFVASDAVGESITTSCTLDGAVRGCLSNSPVNYTSLIDGSHVFNVNVKNQSGASKDFQFLWSIDATVPVIAGQPPAAGAPLTGPFTITFSEPVEGVTASSLTVHAETANEDIPGTVARPTPSTATWTPSAPLDPGETYRFSFTTVIHDLAGNPLTATFFTVQTSTTAENLYVPISPKRVLDTRTGVGLSATTFKANVPRTLSVAGSPGIPADAVAITGNLTVVGQTKGGYLSITTAPTSSPTTSTLNFPVGDVRANGVTVPLNGSGDLSIVYKSGAGGTAHVVLDVTGYFRASASGASYVPVTPARIVDTRFSLGLSSSLVSSTPRTFTVDGKGGVGADAVAIAGNVTVVGQTKGGYLSITTAPTSTPTTSTLNFPVGDVRANNFVVKVSANGTDSATYKSTSGAATHLLVDVTGYYH